MQTNTNQDVTDVEFREVPVETKVVEVFNPVVFLTELLRKAGYPEPEAWTLHLDPRAQTAEDEKDRIFFANRAIRLYIAEQAERENISPRMLLAEGIDSDKWAALMEQGVVPWLMGKFGEKGNPVTHKAEENLSKVQEDQAIPQDEVEQELNPDNRLTAEEVEQPKE